MKPALVWKGVCKPKSPLLLACEQAPLFGRAWLLFTIDPRWRACSQAIVFGCYFDWYIDEVAIHEVQRYKVKANAKFLLTFAWELFMYAWQVNFSGITFFFLNFFSNWELRLVNWRQIMKRPSTGQARSFLVKRRLDETQIYMVLFFHEYSRTFPNGSLSTTVTFMHWTFLYFCFSLSIMATCPQRQRSSKVRSSC